MRKAFLWKASRERGTCKLQDGGKVLEGREHVCLSTYTLSCFPTIIVFPPILGEATKLQSRGNVAATFVAWHLDNSLSRESTVLP